MKKTRKYATISDVAEHAGVSIATVSRVLTGNTPVIEETAERVRAAIAELRFVPRTAARTLASRKTNTIGLILSEIGGAFFPHLLKGIEAEVRTAGYELLIHSTQGVRQHQHRAVGEHNTDGLLVFTSSLELDELKRLHSMNFPLVLMHQTPPADLNIPVITIENKDGAEMLVSHLIEKHGRRRIVYMQGPEGHEDSQWRERGYREALEKHNIPFDPSLVVKGEFDEEQASSTMQQMIADGIEFDAVFAGDDDAAMGVYRALKLTSRIIPDDVAVVGFDDIQFARYISPALTTIRAPIEEVGREAVRQLIHLLNGQQAQSLVLMRTELVIRRSCGCALSDHHQ
ncbi:LacI family DNA-binding transcriptional regulator [Candidatus Villigracilis affinis]|uniref:LacI family DNA-binding transcriptional regulator n=1 Tax=Candidatus Villigracilis affinis TaxID=3140682 RepID=UPI001DA8E6A4|nr:LacI family DNA-binding transcriptional regulator [Anaerolineales bacterium]